MNTLLQNKSQIIFSILFTIIFIFSNTAHKFTDKYSKDR